MIKTEEFSAERYGEYEIETDARCFGGELAFLMKMIGVDPRIVAAQMIYTARDYGLEDWMGDNLDLRGIDLVNAACRVIWAIEGHWTWPGEFH